MSVVAAVVVGGGGCGGGGGSGLDRGGEAKKAALWAFFADGSYIRWLSERKVDLNGFLRPFQIDSGVAA